MKQGIAVPVLVIGMIAFIGLLVVGSNQLLALYSQTITQTFTYQGYNWTMNADARLNSGNGYYIIYVGDQLRGERGSGGSSDLENITSGGSFGHGIGGEARSSTNNVKASYRLDQALSPVSSVKIYGKASLSTKGRSLARMDFYITNEQGTKRLIKSITQQASSTGRFLVEETDFTILVTTSQFQFESKQGERTFTPNDLQGPLYLVIETTSDPDAADDYAISHLSINAVEVISPEQNKITPEIVSPTIIEEEIEEDASAHPPINSPSLQSSSSISSNPFKIAFTISALIIAVAALIMYGPIAAVLAILLSLIAYLLIFTIPWW